MSESHPGPTLPADEPAEPRGASPVEPLLAEQRSRWERGDRAPVEALVEQCSALRDDAEGLLCLIFNEVILREERGESPRAEEYRPRFPDLAARIDLQFAMDEAFRGNVRGPGAVTETRADPSPGAGGPSEALTPPSLPGYEILEELGRGGMGVVYMARQLGLNRVVAVKMVLAGAEDAEREGRFRAEAEAVARLQNPNIIQVYEVGEHRGRPFFSMEYCPGGGLDKKLGGTPLPPREAASLTEKLARAVQAAHQARVVHRDLKPANVLLAADGTPKVTDFGLAKRLDAASAQTRTGDILGTPSYMAPEQARGRRDAVGPPADIYALGAILYECLTGRPPFKAATVLDTLAQVVADDPVPPRRLQSKTPRDLETVCLKCLQKAPARRYPTAQDLAEDLRRFLAGEPVRARSVGALGRGWRWAARRKAPVGLAAAAASALVLAAALVWQAVVQASELSRAVERDLGEAARLEREARWAEARVAVGRAQERLARGGRDDLVRRVGQAADDLEMAARLEEIPLLRTAMVREGWDYESADRAYREAFAGYGLDLGAVEADAAAARVQHSAIKEALTESLDDWLLNYRGGDDSFRRRLFEVVQRSDPDEWRCRVRQAAHNKDRELLKRLADDPEAVRLSPAMTILLADALARVGDRPRALELLRAAQRRRPDHFWINYKTGYDLNEIKGDRQEEAIGFMRAALAVRPQSPGIHIQLGSAMHFQARFKEAEAEFRQAIDIQPDLVTAHDDLGYLLLQQGRLDEAEPEIRKALELGPNYSAVHVELGHLLRDRGHLEQAEAELRKALELQPNNAAAHVGLGSVLEMRGQNEAAEAEYHSALEIRPNDAWAHNGLGRIQCARGKYDVAEAEYRKAIEFQPTNPDSHRNLGNVLLNRKQYDSAEAEYRKAIELQPSSPESHARLGDTLSGQQQYDNAEAEYRKALEIRPNDVAAHVGLGNLLWDEGQAEASEVEYRKALEIQPNSTAAHYDLGNVLRGRGQYAAAEAELRKALESQPNNAMANRELGITLKGQARFLDALEVARKWLQQPSLTDDQRKTAEKEVREYERLVELDGKLSAVLRGDAQPASARERMEYGEICQWKKLYAAAVRFSSDAFSADPKLVEKVGTNHRYNAACAAALACDAAGAGEEDRTRWRRQALEWLEEDLAEWGKRQESNDPQTHAPVARTMRHWQVDPDLAGVREPEELAKLPDAEREPWRKLWAEVDALLQRARTPKPKGP